MKRIEISIVLAILTIVFGSLWLSCSVWSECRSEGHSFFYCLSLVSR